MIDVDKTIVSQYASSPALTAIIHNINVYLDPRANFDAFISMVWDVRTAQGWGLDVWGRIVGVGRVLTIATDEIFGFDEAGDTEGFDVGRFYNDDVLTENYALSDTAYRSLILAKAAANLTDCSIPAINAILATLFPDNLPAYVVDNLDMSLVYTFTGQLSPVDLSIVVQSGVLPKPAGVSATVVQL